MDREIWWFREADAVAAAREVVHHDPDAPWERIPMPADAAAAAASLSALATEFQNLPPSIRGALGRATGNAAQLSDDRLQGLAELLQNADDEGADTAYFHVNDGSLFFGHNGSDFTLPDVWGLTIPWLSEKSGQAEKLGRFGIGLKTLQSLSETLEAHNGHFHLRLGRSSLESAEPDPRWPNGPQTATTVFVVPFQHGTTTETEVASWLESWSDAGLLFLRSLRLVHLLDKHGQSITTVGVSTGSPKQIESAGGIIVRTVVEAKDGRSWLRYLRDAKSPAGHRAGKAQQGTTSVAVAFPRFDGDQGHVHIGLPVRSIGLPFRFAAQFDPLANRRDLADSQWNTDLVGIVSDLWLDSVLDLFRIDPASAWAAVPLAAEYSGDTFAANALDDAVIDRLLTGARLSFADRVRIVSQDGNEHALGDLAYESPDLTAILTAEDIRHLAGTVEVLSRFARSADGRWRAVIDDLNALGAETPTLVDVRQALQLLNVEGRTIAFIADLTAAAVAALDGPADEGLAEQLLSSPCLVLTDGRRMRPDTATGRHILLPQEPSQLWSSLGIGSQLHPAYMERPAWSVILRWLHDSNAMRRTATDGDALRVLAEAGRSDDELPEPLSDEQVNAVRAALESVDETTRVGLAAGIGRAIKLEATVYDAQGRRTQVFARPADAYFIEKERSSWSNAAKKTPGLVWLHRRYLEALRSSAGRAGLGTQKFFRLLGAENVPRLEAFPSSSDYYKHFAYHPPGLWRTAPGSPPRRNRQMLDVGAECTLDDHSAPDLEKVLSDIASERNAQQRRERANALVACLGRNWDRFEPLVKVTAANPYNGWIPKGEVDAWWINTAASIPWLSNAKGKAAPPGDLRVRTASNEAMHGSDPSLYMHQAYEQPAHPEVLAALGVEGNPTVAALLEKLREIRDAHQTGTLARPATTVGKPLTTQEVADHAAPFYQALAAEAHGGPLQRVGNMQHNVFRSQFDRGDGLIITNHGWRRTALTRSGPPVFGDLLAFVPAVTGAERLWTALGVRAPGVDDAKVVLKKLPRTRPLSTDERQIMLESLRILAQATPDRRGQLRRQPVYVGTRWTSTRPVYAVENPLLAEGLDAQVAIWQPGGQLTQLRSLIAPLGLTLIDSTHAHVIREISAIYDADLTATFRSALRNLQTDLTQSAAASAEAIGLTWEQLAGFQVAVLPDLQVQVDLPQGASHRVSVPAWLEIERDTLFVNSREDASRARSGGYAIASCFDTSPREIAHAWLAAWSDAEIGAQTELVVSASARAAEEKLRRERSQAALKSLPTPREQTPRPSRKSKKGSAASQDAPGGRPALPKARTLIDPEALVLRDFNGELIADTSRGEGIAGSITGSGTPRNSTSRLVDPKRDHPKQPSNGNRGRLNYTAQEREDAGMELLRMVLAGDGCTLTDVRHQPNVGADAVDEHGRFYELKVHQGPIPDSVKIEDSQVQRAMESPDEFFLVVIGNVEEGQGNPEVRIIHDPLHHLEVQPQGAVHLTGVRKAGMARSWTFELSMTENGDESQEVE